MSNDPSTATEALAGADALSSSDGSAEAVVTAPTAAGTAVPARRTRVRLLAVGRRLARFAFALALLAVGAWGGIEAFRANQPVAAPVGNPVVNGVPAPAVVLELASAIDSNDTDRVRTTMSPEIFDSYAAELQKYALSSVDTVDVVGTYVDGPRSATMLVLSARRTDTNPFTLFLVVQTQDGQIVRLR